MNLVELQRVTKRREIGRVNWEVILGSYLLDLDTQHLFRLSISRRCISRIREIKLLVNQLGVICNGHRRMYVM